MLTLELTIGHEQLDRGSERTLVVDGVGVGVAVGIVLGLAIGVGDGLGVGFASGAIGLAEGVGVALGVAVGVAVGVGVGIGPAKSGVVRAKDAVEVNRSRNSLVNRDIVSPFVT